MIFLILVAVMIYYFVKVSEECMYGGINRLVDDNAADVKKRWRDTNG